MSKTPRTLSEPKSYTDLEYAVMYKSRCEKLEAELAEARAEIERLNKNLRLLLCRIHFDKCEAGLFNSKNPDDEPCLICLMGAAERGE